MTYNGKRDPTVDYFDDILSETGGIHDGGALTQFDRVKQKITPEGLNVQVNCALCGKGHEVLLEWEELFVVAMNGPGRPMILPPHWQYSENNADVYFAARCSRCNDPGLAVHETPEDAQKVVNEANKRGFIRPQQLAAWKAQFQRAAGG